MFTKKEIVLANAVIELNKPDTPFEVTVENNTIIARWKWMNSTFLSTKDISNNVKSYEYRVKLRDDGKYKEKSNSTSSNVGLPFSLSGGGGKIKFNAFSGKSFQKSIKIGLGRDNNTGKIGIIKNSFDSALITKPIKAYLEKYGWKKARFFE